MDPWGEISVVLTDDNGIEAINRRCLDHAGSTDVISFSFSPLPGFDESRSGEILVNVQQAHRADRRSRWGPEDELALYIAHGLNHLAGGNDDLPEGRQRMRRQELHSVRAARDRGLLDRLLSGDAVESGRARRRTD